MLGLPALTSIASSCSSPQSGPSVSACAPAMAPSSVVDMPAVFPSALPFTPPSSFASDLEHLNHHTQFVQTIGGTLAIITGIVVCIGYHRIYNLRRSSYRAAIFGMMLWCNVVWIRALLDVKMLVENYDDGVQTSMSLADVTIKLSKEEKLGNDIGLVLPLLVVFVVVAFGAFWDVINVIFTFAPDKKTASKKIAKLLVAAVLVAPAIAFTIHWLLLQLVKLNLIFIPTPHGDTFGKFICFAVFGAIKLGAVAAPIHIARKLLQYIYAALKHSLPFTTSTTTTTEHADGEHGPDTNQAEGQTEQQSKTDETQIKNEKAKIRDGNELKQTANEKPRGLFNLVQATWQQKKLIAEAAQRQKLSFEDVAVLVEETDGKILTDTQVRQQKTLLLRN
eukprot:GHVT01045387.1.p1 GENE.GHVT01045387.1~~GHVT01045387.1.p1  ORF type:complete len:392 (+),score=63.25 GHVT01045387.1:902-2077(+)